MYYKVMKVLSKDVFYLRALDWMAHRPAAVRRTSVGQSVCTLSGIPNLLNLAGVDATRLSSLVE
jgi:hypothetical protein